MKHLFTNTQYQQLLQNGSNKIKRWDLHPVAKLTMPGHAFSWLLTDIDPQDPNVGYGLYIEFDGFIAYGSVDLKELLTIKDEMGFGIENDPSFNAKFSLEVYKSAHWWHGHLVEDEEMLQRFVIEPMRYSQLSLF
ncbi:DUF2958 domain-containing protein [Chitinophaga oryziterrae]|uniref:DUF2958 domain-containing protein n=1 Tax=Chitinophaga oryziterrae TaxID=1031224 RepID=A0A6N8JB10_9BACT|nr:DUF2958 domain-containing protein [Chitinophaga oryziterrae]MVT42410.1 DUF2958 domain-containing protein [Chitinophaga oryziterrae]